MVRLWDLNFKNKKAQGQEILLLGVIMFVLAITIIVAARIITDVNDQFQTSDGFSQTAKTSVGDYTNRFIGIFDGIYAFAIVLLAILVIVSVFLIDTHPIFLALSIPALMVSLFVNVILANALDEIGNTSGLAVIYNQFTMMLFISAHWLQILAIIGFTAVIVLYSKRLNP